MPQEVASTQTSLLSEDYRGRIQEIQQIVSYRFQIATLAIVVFTGVSGWLATSLARLDGTSSGMAREPALFLAVASLLLVIVMFVLYYEYFALYRTLRIYSTYLVAKYDSVWERDWKAYRNHTHTKKYPGYSASGYRIFTLLTSLSVIYPFALLLTFWADVTLQPKTLFFLLPTMASVAVLRYIRGTYWLTRSASEEDILFKGWLKVLESTNDEKTHTH